MGNVSVVERVTVVAARATELSMDPVWAWKQVELVPERLGSTNKLG